MTLTTTHIKAAHCSVVGLSRLGSEYLCECVRLHWDHLRIRQYSRVHKLISVNNNVFLSSLVKFVMELLSFLCWNYFLQTAKQQNTERKPQNPRSQMNRSAASAQTTATAAAARHMPTPSREDVMREMMKHRRLQLELQQKKEELSNLLDRVKGHNRVRRLFLSFYNLGQRKIWSIFYMHMAEKKKQKNLY